MDAALVGDEVSRTENEVSIQEFQLLIADHLNLRHNCINMCSLLMITKFKCHIKLDR